MSKGWSDFEYTPIMKEPEETPAMFGKPLTKGDLKVEEDVMSKAVSKVNLVPVLNGICYICLHPRAEVIGKIKDHGGAICLGCAMRYLV